MPEHYCPGILFSHPWDHGVHFQVVEYRLLGSRKRLGGSVWGLLGSKTVLLGSRNQLFISLLGSKLVLWGSAPNASNKLITIGTVYQFYNCLILI